MLLNAKRLDNNVNVLQCVEALRHYAATHDGQLPEKLSDITDLELPKDAVSGEAFVYRRTAKGAVLESKMPERGDSARTLQFRYEVVLNR